MHSFRRGSKVLGGGEMRRAVLWISVALVSGLVVPAQGIDGVLLVERLGPGSPTDVAPGQQGQYMPIELKVRNVSKKSITAFRATLKLTYPDKSEQELNWLGADLVESIAETRIPNVARVPVNMTLYPGEAFTVPVTIPLGASGAPAEMKAIVTTVIFEDRTWVGDPKWASAIFQSRKNRGEWLNSLLSAVREAESAGEPERRYNAMISDGTLASVDRVNATGGTARLREYLAKRGTLNFNLMRQIDEARAQALRQHAIPAEPIHLPASSGKAVQ